MLNGNMSTQISDEVIDVLQTAYLDTIAKGNHSISGFVSLAAE